MWRSLQYVSATVIAAAVGLVLAGSAPAQEVSINYELEPKDGAAFEAALKEHSEYRMEQEDPWQWGVWQEVAGPNTGTYLVRSGGHSWADFDSYEPGENVSLHFEAGMDQAVETTHTWFAENDTALTRFPEDASELRFAEVVTFHIEPGKQAQFDDAVEQFHNAVVASDWPIHYNFIDPGMGSKGPQKIGAYFYENYADMQAPETPMMQMLQSEMGEEKAESLLDQFSDAIRYTESQLFVYRPDLSVEPAEGEGGGQ